MLQAGRSLFLFLMSLYFSIVLILPAAVCPLIETSTRNLPGENVGGTTRKADNLIAICEPFV
jgi:hypothetical protein